MGTILVVEDESFISLVVSDGLQDAGYNVLTATNADEAIGVLEKNKIRYIFTDIDMPGGSMDGLALAADVRRRWPPIDIIITTGKSRPEQSQMPAGSVFLAKPYSPSDVVQTVRDFRSSDPR